MTDDILTYSSDKQSILTGKDTPVDQDVEILSLRPERLIDYIGQAKVVETLKIAIDAALQRHDSIDHVLFHGPPGLGKTTLAHIIANEMGVNLTVTSGPALEKGGDLIGILTNLEEGDILFIDEIHRTPKSVEEFLYPAMEDFSVNFVFDKGVHARSHKYRLKRFALVGATTRVGLLSSPLRDRFGILRRLDFYNDQELIEIGRRSAGLLGVDIDDEGAYELSKRSRGTPRITNRLLKRVRDYSQVRADGKITQKAVEEALSLEEVDEMGLTKLDRQYLKTVIEFYHGGPVGIEAISATLQEEADTLVDVVEPYLLKIGMINRTSSGRRASESAYRHLGFDVEE
jgi:Holliday junction DNA helicase RuvB